MVERMHARETVEGLLLSRCRLPLSWVQTFFLLSLLSERWVGLKSIIAFAEIFSSCFSLHVSGLKWEAHTGRSGQLWYGLWPCVSHLDFFRHVSDLNWKYICATGVWEYHINTYKHPQEMVQLLQEPSWGFYEGEMFCELDQTNPTNG